VEAVGFAGANEMRARKTREARSTIGDGGRISSGPGRGGLMSAQASTCLESLGGVASA
jgi:hypothetical protein